MFQDKPNSPSGLELTTWYKVGFSIKKYQQSSGIPHQASEERSLYTSVSKAVGGSVLILWSLVPVSYSVRPLSADEDIGSECPFIADPVSMLTKSQELEEPLHKPCINLGAPPCAPVTSTDNPPQGKKQN